MTRHLPEELVENADERELDGSRPLGSPGKLAMSARIGQRRAGPKDASPGKVSRSPAMLARAPISPGPAPVESPPRPVINALENEQGSPLPDAARWSRRVGADVSGARVVKGSAAASAATAVGARAFTVGRRVFFGNGEYAPGTKSGDEVMRHELTHVAQQQGAPMPDYRSLEIAAPDSHSEHEARGGGSLTATRAQISGFSEPFQSTPGGQRIGKDLTPAIGATPKKIRARIPKRGEHYLIDRDYDDQHGTSLSTNGNGFASALNDAVDRIPTLIRTELGSVDAAREARALKLFYDDLGSLTDIAFFNGTFSFGTFKANVDRIAGTYKHLAGLYARRSGTNDVVTQPRIDETKSKEKDNSKLGQMEREFQRRANLFVNFARDSKTGLKDSQIDYMLEGLAADTQAFETSEGDAPVNAAQGLVNELVDDKLSDLSNVEALYKKVIADALYQPGTTNASRTLLWAIEARHLGGFIIAAAKKRAVALKTAGKDAELAALRTTFAREIGAYLARLGGPRSFNIIFGHLKSVSKLTKENIPEELVKIIDKGDDVAPKPAPPTPTPKPKPAPPATPKHACKDYGYSFSFVNQWLNNYWDDRKAYSKTRFDPSEIRCQFEPGEHTEPITQVASNVADFKAMANRALRFINKYVRRSEKRAKKIVGLRGKLGMKVSELIKPDYVTDFRLDSTFYTILQRAAKTDPLDPADEEAATKDVVEHFFREEAYQNALIAALELISKSSGTIAYLKKNYEDTHYVDVSELKTLSGTLPAWIADNHELDKADGLDTRVKQVTALIDTGDSDILAEKTEEIEDGIYKLLPDVITELRKKGDNDQLYVSTVWPKIEPLLWQAGTADEKRTAKNLLKPIVEQANKDHLDVLVTKMGMETANKDTVGANATLKRVQKLARDLKIEKHAGTITSVKSFIDGEASNLLGVLTMAQAALGTSPGQTVRMVNLLKEAMTHGNKSTLTGAYKHSQTMSFMIHTFNPEVHARVKKGSMKGIVDDLTFNYVADANLWLTQSARKGALRILMDAEKAGGGVPRAKKLIVLAEKCRAGDAQGVAVAKFVYAYAMDVAHLIDEGIQKDDKKREKAIKQLKGETKERGADGEKNDKKVPWHPAHNRPLTEQEKKWFAEWGKITGETTSWYEPSEETWAMVTGLAKDLLKMLAIGLVAGPVAAGIAGEATLGALLLEVAIFTGANRLITDLETGVSPKTGFTEDFILNLAMMKATRFAHKGFDRILAAKGWNPNVVVKGAGRFAAEWAAVSGVSIAHLAIKKGTSLSAKDVANAALHNFAFLAAMKGSLVLGAGATNKVVSAFDIKAIPGSVKKQLRAQDDLIEGYAKQANKAKDSQQQVAALNKQIAAVEKKAKILEKAGKSKPYLVKMAASYRTAVSMYKGDSSRAATMVTIGAQPKAGTPHFTYQRSSFAENALVQQFTRAGFPYKARRGLRGTTFEVITPSGKIRFSPRGSAPKGAGTAKGAYTDAGRLEATVIKGPKELFRALNLKEYRGILHPKLRGKTKGTFTIRHQGTLIKIQIKVVDAHTVKTVHRAGPVAMEIHRHGKKSLSAHIEVRRNTSNDQLVRGLNHEMTELLHTVQRVKAKAPQGNIGKLSESELRGLLTAEGKTGMLTRKPGSQASAHDVALLEGDLRTLLLQMESILKQMDNPRATASEQVLLQKRLDLLSNDVKRMWSLLRLPKDKKAFGSRIDAIEKTAKIKLSDEARDMLNKMYMARVELKGFVRPRITEVELQIIFNELKTANPKLVQGAMLDDLIVYYREAIKAKAQKAIDGHLAKNPGDTKGAIAAGMAVVKRMAGGTSISSWRGRSFEGLSIKEWNADKALVARHGYLYQIQLNNFKTFDALAVKNAPGRVSMVIKNGRQYLYSQGKIIYRQGKKGGKDYIRPGVEIRMVSMKAKKSANLREMTKAIGTPTKPTGHGMLVTPEYMKDLETLIARSQARVTNLTSRVSAEPNLKARLAREQTRLQTLQFFKQNIEVSAGWNNTKLDAMLNAVKRAGIDWQDLKREIKKYANDQ